VRKPEKTINYACFNYSIIIDFDIHRKINFLLSKKVKIETIYLTADDHTLSLLRESKNNTDRSILFLTNIDFDDFYSFFKERYLKYYIPIFSQNEISLIRRSIKGGLKKIFSADKGEKAANNKKSQLLWHELSSEQKFQAAEARKSNHFPSNEKSLKLEETLIDIIKLCNKNNIKLIGLKFPLANEYIQVLGETTYNSDKILKEHGITVLDFRRIFIKNPEFFANQDHLNNKGGEKFSELLFGNNINSSKTKK